MWRRKGNLIFFTAPFYYMHNHACNGIWRRKRIQFSSWLSCNIKCVVENARTFITELRGVFCTFFNKLFFVCKDVMLAKFFIVTECWYIGFVKLRENILKCRIFPLFWSLFCNASVYWGDDELNLKIYIDKTVISARCNWPDKTLDSPT